MLGDGEQYYLRLPGRSGEVDLRANAASRRGRRGGSVRKRNALKMAGGGERGCLSWGVDQKGLRRSSKPACLDYIRPFQVQNFI